MHRDEFDRLTNLRPARPAVSTDLLADLTDRTLVYGYNLDRTTFHVYLADGTIHRILYRPAYAEGDGAIEVFSHDAKHRWDAADLVPSKRAYPERCDYAFCRLLVQKGFPVPFTTYKDDRHAPGTSFHGKTAGHEPVVNPS